MKVAVTGVVPGFPGVAKVRNAMTPKEVLAASDPDTLCLVIIGECVYDCTKWQNNHPGGALPIRALCGKDGTEPFRLMHPEFVNEQRLRPFFYADVKDKLPNDDVTRGYHALTKQMKEAGMFETDMTFYYKQWFLLAILLCVVVFGVLNSESFWVHAVCGLLLGLFWQQLAFTGHDLGHNQVLQDRVGDSMLGLFLGNLLQGIGLSWWKRSHNVHHVVTNSVEHDPDIQHLPVFAVSPKYIAGPVFSTFHNRFLTLNSVTHVFVAYQHFLYYPIMAFGRFNLYAQSILHVLGKGQYSLSEKIWQRKAQTVALLGFWIWLLALTAQIPTWQSKAAFFFLSHAFTGILHIQITLSHFGMKTYNGVTYDNDSNGFLKTQMETSTDIDCPTWMDWFHGGLQFQVIHHLWPRMPRHNLRKAQTLFKSFCAEHNLKYHHDDFLAVNRMVLSKLRETAMKAKSFNELFNDSWNMAG